MPVWNWSHRWRDWVARCGTKSTIDGTRMPVTFLSATNTASVLIGVNGYRMIWYAGFSYFILHYIYCINWQIDEFFDTVQKRLDTDLCNLIRNVHYKGSLALKEFKINGCKFNPGIQLSCVRNVVVSNTLSKAALFKVSISNINGNDFYGALITSLLGGLHLYSIGEWFFQSPYLSFSHALTKLSTFFRACQHSSQAERCGPNGLQTETG